MSDHNTGGLEIHKLDQNGAVARRIGCLPGRITVLRSVNPTELDMYEQALLGRPSAGRFTILFRGAPYIPGRHNLIGAGSDFIVGDKKTAHQYLSSCGVPETSIEKLLLNFSLGGLSEVPCAELGAAQQKVLRILAVPSMPDSVHVLIDPFAGLPEDLREKVGKYLSDFVAQKGGVVVVPRLGERPEGWVENEYISRVQLERPRKKTVGFGSDALNREEILEHLRASGAYTAPAQATPVPSKMLRWASISSICVCVAVTGFVYYEKATTPEIVIQASPAAMVPVKEEPEHAEVRVSHYPPAVQEAVLKAFLRPEEVLHGQVAAAAPQISTQNLRASFEQSNARATSGTTESDAEQESPDVIEAKREEIRQRFLEAIARAERGSQGDSSFGD